jgi:serine/threonine-protein kinase
MRRHGPLLTLLTGLVLAVVLTALSIGASRNDAAKQQTTAQNAANTTVAPSTPASTAPATTAAPTPVPPLVTATWAGSVDGGAASIAITARSGGAVAYLCDGKRVEAWLLGSAVGGKLSLTGKNNANLTGTFGNGVATGTLSAGGKQWTFKVPVVTAPSGLYRASATVRNAKVVGGWIVLPNGNQVGVVNRAGVPEPATTLDVTSRSAVVDGTPVTAYAVDGTAPLND